MCAAAVNKLFRQRFQPKTIDQAILSPRLQRAFGSGELSQNYLFTGSPGTGKTTIAKILSASHPTLYINCSGEGRGIETVRETITHWCSTHSIKEYPNPTKVVIMDEIDGAVDSFFNALRATIDKFSNCRFIATCNYINKIPDAINSRFMVIHFDPVDKSEELELMKLYYKRIKAISTKKLGMTWEGNALSEFVKRNFPDFRKLLEKLQYFQVEGLTTIREEDVIKFNYSYKDVFELTIADPDPVKNYQYLMSNYQDKVDSVFASLGSEYVEWLRENAGQKITKIPNAIVTIANYQAQRVHVIQPQISMLACIFQLQQIMNGV